MVPLPTTTGVANSLHVVRHTHVHALGVFWKGVPLFDSLLEDLPDSLSRLLVRKVTADIVRTPFHGIDTVPGVVVGKRAGASTGAAPGTGADEGASEIRGWKVWGTPGRVGDK
jgi:hypothetical protein